MSNDDDRIAYLAGEDGVDVDDATRADLDELRRLLADDTLWAVPPSGLEESIVAAIAEEARTRSVEPDTAAAPAAAPVPPPPPPAGGTVTSLASHRARRMRGFLAAAAAVVVLAAGGVFLATRDRDRNGTAVALEPGPLGAGASGTAHVKRFPSGWRIMLDATGLPRLDNGQFYEAWLKDADGVLVPIGTFNEGSDVVLWAGVSPERFSTLTVTKELDDGEQASSKQVVLQGTIVLDAAATS